VRKLQIGTGTVVARTDSINKYLTDVSKIPLLTPTEEYEIALKASEGDEQAVDLLVKSNLRFVISIAKMYSNSAGDKLDDLISTGNIGLLEAARKFDPTRGFKFISFAVWHIRKEIHSYLNKTHFITTVPVYYRELSKKIEQAKGHYMARTGFPPTEEEIAEYLRERYVKSYNVTTETVKECILYSNKHSSLDSPISSDGETVLIDILPDRDTTMEPVDNTLVSARKAFLKKVLNTPKLVNPKEKEIFMKRYFTQEYYVVDFETISKELHLSTDHVTTIHTRVINKIKKYLARHPSLLADLKF
jgi:RNA polymerase primary sigma factor